MDQIKLAIKQLFIYPVKSLAGIEISESQALKTGLKYDRQYMLVNEKGIFITQRQFPEMVLIQTALENNQLVFSRNGFSQKSLNVEQASGDKVSINARVWRDECDTFEPDTQVSEWFCDVLQQKVRLVSLLKNRPQSSPERFGETTTTFFADAAPYLIANQASLSALNHMLSYKGLETVDIRRFRPNIVVEGGLAAFSEHEYTNLSSDSFTFTLIDHCERCIVTTIDPDKGTRDPALEPFKTVAEINPMPNNAKSPAFGVNALFTGNDAVDTILRVGDQLSIGYANAE